MYITSGKSNFATEPEESKVLFCTISTELQLDTWQDMYLGKRLKMSLETVV